MRQRSLSTIELTVLGMAWLRGPCTTYALMKELSTSESTYYKSRAGTAYSVVDRLTRFKLLETVSLQSGKENRVQITGEGVVELRKWLTPPVPVSELAHSADLVRLRMFFIGILEPDERIALIDDTLIGLRQHLERCEALIPQNEAIGDRFGALATIGVVMETKARIEWLETIRDRVWKL